MSITVSVTLFAPRSEHVNAEGATDREAIPQASEEPLFTSAAVIVAFPVASKETVMFRHNAVGETVSSTVTVELQVAVFPLVSVTVKMTVFVPTSEQLKLLGETDREAIPQLSVDPLSTSAAEIVALPAASNETVILEQLATGFTISSTVTVAVHVELFPFTSVTVRVTELAPILAQVKVEGETVIVSIPQLSDEPLSMSVAAITAFPVASSCTVKA